MTVHELKISPKYFDDVRKGFKTFLCDLVTLKEYENGKYTGRELKNLPIIYILRDCPEYGLKEGYCILGLYT